LLFLTSSLTAQIPFDYGSTTRLTGEAITDDAAVSICARGDLACRASYSIMTCVDIADPNDPLVLGRAIYDPCWPEEMLFIDDTHVAIVGDTGKVTIFDVADPDLPTVSSVTDLGTILYGATLTGSILVMHANFGLQCLDVADPTAPASVGPIFTDQSFYGLATLPSGEILATQNDNIMQVNLADPEHPVIVRSFAPKYLPGFVPYRGVVVTGSMACIEVQSPYPLTTTDGNRNYSEVFLVDLKQEDFDGLVGHWPLGYLCTFGLHDTMGDLVYGNVDGNLIIFDTSRRPPNLHAFEPDLCIPVNGIISDAAGGNHAVGLAVNHYAVDTLPAGEARGIPALTRFARGHNGALVSSRWAYSTTWYDSDWLPHYKYYLWDLADPLHPVKRDSMDCDGSWGHSVSRRAVDTQDGLVVCSTHDDIVDIISIQDFDQNPPTSADLDNGHDSATLVGDLLVTYDPNDPEIHVFDLTEPAAPIAVGQANFQDVEAIHALSDSHAFVFNRTPFGLYWLEALDLSDPTQPQAYGFVELDERLSHWAAHGDLLLAGDLSGEVHVIDYTTMTVLATLPEDYSGGLAGIAMDEDGRAWINWGSGGLHLVDLTDPSNPVVIADPLEVPWSRGMTVIPEANAAYLASRDAGVQLVTTDAHGELSFVGGGGVHADKVVLCGDYVGVFGAILPPAALDVTTVPGETVPTVAAGSVRATPNPFNPQTVISFAVPEAGAVELGVYDLCGRLVRSWNEDAAAGEHSVTWDGRDAGGREVSAGVYLLRLWTAGELATGRVCLVK